MLVGLVDGRCEPEVRVVANENDVRAIRERLDRAVGRSVVDDDHVERQIVVDAERQRIETPEHRSRVFQFTREPRRRQGVLRCWSWCREAEQVPKPIAPMPRTRRKTGWKGAAARIRPRSLLAEAGIPYPRSAATAPHGLMATWPVTYAAITSARDERENRRLPQGIKRNRGTQPAPARPLSSLQLTKHSRDLEASLIAHMPNAPFPRPPRTYAAVTPARDEIENLPRLFASLEGSDGAASRVDGGRNGCSDGTVEYVEQLSLEHDWVHLVQSEAENHYARTGRAYIVAVHAGVAALPLEPDVLVKLDADVSFQTGFFERILGGVRGGSRARDHERRVLGGERRTVAGAADPRGSRLGPDAKLPVAGSAVRLPARGESRSGQVDETKAHLAGWRTGTQHDLPFRHHRPEGSGDGSKAGRGGQRGKRRTSWATGRSTSSRRPPTVCVPTGRQQRSFPGYLDARRRRRPQLSDQAVRHAIRERQRLSVLARRLFVAVRERTAEVARADRAEAGLAAHPRRYPNGGQLEHTDNRPWSPARPACSARISSRHSRRWSRKRYSSVCPAKSATRRTSDGAIWPTPSETRRLLAGRRSVPRSSTPQR